MIENLFSKLKKVCHVWGIVNSDWIIIGTVFFNSEWDLT